MLIPVLTMIFDPITAIVAATLLDMISGLVLYTTVFKRSDWKLVLPVTFFLGVGAYFGAALIPSISPQRLEDYIAVGLLIFVVALFFQNGNTSPRYQNNKTIRILGYPISLVAGFGGGLLGISGPLLVLYMKFLYDKTYFRDQLIAIFLFGAIWRFSIYQTQQLQLGLSPWLIISMSLVGLLGLWLGSRLHITVNERKFNRLVALILILPALNMLFLR